MAFNIFTLMGSIMVDNDKANKSISDTDKKAQGVTQKLVGGISTAAKWGAAIAAAGAAAAVAIGVKATKAAMDFEAQMSNVATLLDGDVNKRIQELGSSVKQVSIDTGASTELLTDGLYQVISAFGDTSDSMSILETAAKGAKAGNATVTDSVNLLAAVTKGYGDTSSEAANKASDLAFLTVKLGQTSFPELASSMGKVIPLASTMKVKQEELFGAMATLTGVTGNTAEVSTQLRATIQGMLQPTTKMAGQIKKLGYENGQAMIESLGLQGTLNKLKDSVGGNEIAFSELFGSVEAKNAVLALTGAQAENFTEKTNAMKNAVGATDEAFKKQTDNVKANMEKLKNTFNVMLISLGEKFLPILNELLKWVDSKMPYIQKILENVFNAIGFVVGTIGIAIKNALTAIQGIVQMVQDQFAYAATIFQEYMEEFDDFGGAVRAALESIFGPIGDLPIFEELGQIISAIHEIIARVKGGESIAGAFREAFEWRDSIIGNNLLELMSFCESIFSNIQGIISTVIENIKPILQGLADIFSTVMSILWTTWENVGKPIWGFICDAIQTVKEVFDYVFPILAETFAGLCDTIKKLWDNILKPVFEFIGSYLKNKLFPSFSIAFAQISEVVKTAFKIVGDLWNQVLKPILDGIILFLGGIFKGEWGRIWEGLVSIVKGIFGGLVNIVKAPINGVVGLVNGMIAGLNKIKLPDWVPGIGGKGINIPKIPLLAKGTTNFQGGMAIVGEQGPELVTMPRGARVHTADETVKKLNGIDKGITINISNFNNYTDNDIEELTEKLAFEIQRKLAF